MNNRRTTAKRLANAPLVLVLCQTRFAAALDLANHLPQLQAVFRKLGFPRFEESRMQPLTVVAAGGGVLPSPLSAHVDVRWTFSSVDRGQAIVLSPTFVTLVVTRYTVFERFEEVFRVILQALQDTGVLSLVTRIGFRSVDLVRPRITETLDQYLVPSLCGFVFDPSLMAEGADRTFLVNSVVIRNERRIVLRSGRLQEGHTLPPDIQTDVVISHVQIDPTERAVALDIDAFEEFSALPFDVGQIQAVAYSLHEDASVTFRCAVMPHALTVWGPEEVLAV